MLLVPLLDTFSLKWDPMDTPICNGSSSYLAIDDFNLVGSVLGWLDFVSSEGSFTGMIFSEAGVTIGDFTLYTIPCSSVGIKNKKTQPSTVN